MKQNDGRKGKKRRDSITFAVLLLAALAVVLVIMSGALDFSKDKEEEEEETQTVAPETVVPESSTPTPETSAKETYTVSITSSEGGSTYPSGTVTANAGDNVTVTFLPDTGYTVGSVTVNGSSYENKNSYQISDISENMTISVVFTPVTPSEEPSPTATATPIQTTVQPTTEPSEAAEPSADPVEEPETEP